MKKEKIFTIERINEIEQGADVTVKEVFALAEVLNVHPFVLLWPRPITSKTSLEIVNDYFKSLTIAKIKKAALIAA